jgi:hypothetical protein
VAFGHPLLERMVHYCRVTRAADLGGKLTCLVADYTGLPGVIFNFLLRFEDKLGGVIREELEPVFIDQEGAVHPELGRKFFMGPSIPETEPNRETLEVIRQKITRLQHATENYIRAQYRDYYRRVEAGRNAEIAILIEDLERFDRGEMEHLKARLREMRGGQQSLFEDPTTKGQRTRIENRIKMHQHRMQERRSELEQMRLGAFPAPELLNMVVIMPV